jgi:hypothetical protein
MVIHMSEWSGKHLDFESFPENLELARNIHERVKGVKDLQAYREARLGPTDVFKNAIAVERYVTQLHADIKYNAAESAMGMCVGAAAEAFLISLACARGTYQRPEDLEKHPVDRDVVTFIKKMGDSIAMNEIDLDLGSSRWTTSTDLLMDMLNALTVVTSSIIMGSDDRSSDNGAEKIDIEYNVITGCTLVAAYAMILYQCIKDGSYRGQTLTDIRKK